MADCGPPQQHHGGCNGAAALREPTQRFSALQQPLLCAAIHFFHRHIRCDAEVLQRMEGNRMFGLFFEVPYHGKPDLSRIFADSVHDCSALHVCSFILSILHQGMFSVSAFIVSVIYLSRFKESSHITLHAYTWRPLFLTSLLLADKMWEDKPVKNSSLAKLFPVLSNLELNTMEREFLLQIHFNILVKPDLFCSFCEKLLIEKVREDICQCVSESEFVSSLLLQQQQPDADGYDCEEVAAGPMPGPGLASVAGMLAPGLRRPYEQATLVAHQQLVPAARSFDEIGQQQQPPAPPQQQPSSKPMRSLSSAAWLQPQGAVKVHVAVAGTQRTPSGQRSPLRAQQLQAAVQPPPQHQQHPHSENIMENGRVKSVDQHAEKRARSGQRQVAQNVSRLHHPARRSLPAKTTVVASYAPFGAKAAAAANGHTPAKHLGTSDGHLSLDVDFNGGPHRAQKTPRSPLGSQPLDQCLQQQQQQQHQQPFLRSHLRQLYQMQQQPWAGQQQQQQQQQHGQHQAPVAWAPTPPAPGPQQHNIAPRGAGMAVRRPMTQQSPGNGAATPLAPGGAVMAAGDFGARPRHSVFPPRSAGPPTRAASAPGVPSAAGGGSSGRHSSPHVSTSSHVRTPSQPPQGCGAAGPPLGSQPALLRPGSPLHSSGLPGGGGGAPTSSFITPPPPQQAGPGGPYRQQVPAMMFQGGAATRNSSPMVAAPGHPGSAPRTSSGGLQLGQPHQGHAGGQPALSTRSLSPVGHAAPGTASSLCLNGLTLQQGAGQRPLAGGPSTARSMSPGHAAPHFAAGPAGPQTARPAQRGASLM